MVKCDIAQFICVCAADKGHIDLLSLVKKPLLAGDIDQLYDILSCLCIELAALESRIAEGVHADMSDGAELVAGDITEELGDRTLRKVIGFQLVVEDQLAELGNHVVVAADDSLEQAFVCKVVCTAAVAVALCCSIEQGQITGMTGLKEALLDRLVGGLRHLACNKARRNECHSIL